MSKPSNTYCGITNNRARRIRQHNGELKRGAKQTRANRPWRMVAVLNGFETKDDAQRFEWSMHNPRVRRLRQPHSGVAGRLNCMRQLLLEHEAWQGRFTNEPIHIIIEKTHLTGTHVRYRQLLNNLDEDCEIHYSPGQLRLYHLAAAAADDGDGDGDDNTCLAKWSLCALEASVCVNETSAPPD
jgi:predicted GIY-YIG superfamily endonuclease